MSARRSQASSFRPKGLTFRPQISGNCTTTTGVVTVIAVMPERGSSIRAASAVSTSVILSPIQRGREARMAAARRAVQAELLWGPPLSLPALLEPEVTRVEPEVITGPAGQYQDLQLAGGALQDGLHGLEPRFVGVDQGVVQDQ